MKKVSIIVEITEILADDFSGKTEKKVNIFPKVYANKSEAERVASHERHKFLEWKRTSGDRYMNVSHTVKELEYIEYDNYSS